jgi:formylglycine-generating enzyme required for sulfatase activity
MGREVDVVILGVCMTLAGAGEVTATASAVGEARLVPAAPAALGGPAEPPPGGPWWMMEREVTHAMWEAVLGEPSPDGGAADDLPVAVTWREARRFAAAMRARDPGAGWRLPTEAEWLWAATEGGGASRYAGGDALVEVGWSALDAEGRAHPGCLKRPTGWGLCDLSGNVSEWVRDAVGLAGGWRVIRGGSWFMDEESAALTVRDGERPTTRRGDVGFRLLRPARPDEVERGAP